MKTNLLSLFLSLSLTTYALALAGDLKEPGLAFPTNFSEPAKLKLMAALKPEAGKFLGGHFVNSSTSLSYGGDTKALNLFLDALAKCPGFTLVVQPLTEENVWQDGADWTVLHNAFLPEQVVVRVNFKSPRIKRENLVMPEAKITGK